MKETRIWIVADRQYRGYERLRVKIMKISELLQRIDYMVLQGNLSDEVTGICHDNRMIQEGDAFICISGARFDTHTMAKELAKKAALLVVEKPVELEDGCKTAVACEEVVHIGKSAACCLETGCVTELNFRIFFCCFYYIGLMTKAVCKYDLASLVS